jgi:hypothetical protein
VTAYDIVCPGKALNGSIKSSPLAFTGGLRRIVVRCYGQACFATRCLPVFDSSDAPALIRFSIRNADFSSTHIRVSELIIDPLKYLIGFRCCPLRSRLARRLRRL